MSRRWSQFNPRHPQPQGCCDGCGWNFLLADLRWQMEWRGAALVRTGMRKCDDCLDVPNPQGRAQRFVPDPVPVRDPYIDPHVTPPDTIGPIQVATVMTWEGGFPMTLESGSPLFWEGANA